MKHLIKVLLVSLVLSFTFINLCSAADLNQAIAKAQKADKKLFIMYGREACGNCQHLKKMIGDGSVKINSGEFIIVDINCDNANEAGVFQTKYSSLGGGYLPFVVIAKPDGTMITSRKGYGEAADYQKFIEEAEGEK